MSQSALNGLFIGSDTLLIQCAEAWLEQGQRIEAILTDNPRVRSFAAERDVSCVWLGEDWSDDHIVQQLERYSFDYLFAVTWLRMLPAAALRLPRRQAINFHDGPLPRYAGLNATCWAIHAGETRHGITWHAIEPSADTGPVLRQELFDIAPEDTALTLNARCFQAGVESFTILAQDLAAGRAELSEQDLDARSYFARSHRPARLGVLDPAGPARESARTVRAFDHGAYRNPVCAAKLWTGRAFLAPSRAAVLEGNKEAAGTVLEIADDSITVATGDGRLQLTGLRTLDGKTLDAAGLQASGITVGAILPTFTQTQADALDELATVSGRSEHDWLGALQAYTPLPVPGATPSGKDASSVHLAVELPSSLTGGATDDSWLRLAGLTCAFLARKTATAEFDIGLLTCNAADPICSGLQFGAVPMHLDFTFDSSVAAAAEAAEQAIATTRRRGPLLREVVLRHPDRFAPGTSLEPAIRLALGTTVDAAPGTLTLLVQEGGTLDLVFDRDSLPMEQAERIQSQLRRFLEHATTDPATPLSEVALLDPTQIQRLLTHGAPLSAPAHGEATVAGQFLAQAARTPDATALTCDGESLTYAQLGRRVDRLAADLRQRGVGRGNRVGICANRGIDLVTAVLATLVVGASYVPLDPGYPADRLQFMVDDATLALLLVDRNSASSAPSVTAPVVVLDDVLSQSESTVATASVAATGDDPAYMIYTSGSTGMPKGVVVLHRNVTNFFAGMDDALGQQEGTEPGTWLAVTSLSFDISVLELLWTLCRGFRVVVHRSQGHQAQMADAARQARTGRPLTFSLFYFASDEGEDSENKYRLLLDGARFADQNGFEAVWTPERHFHAFGGLYPNPAVASAAVAAVTERVHIRAGSVVSPLHNPIRIAEDWALVDNLSSGRVGISFAAGWQPNDFVLAPSNFADRKAQMFRDIDAVHRLWRGETVDFPGHDGKPVAVRTLPRPVQERLPTWVTIAGNPETYRQAGEHGSYVLTHLLGQSIEELGEKLNIYREAWQQAGHEGQPRTSLMLHTYVGEDEERVREVVRGPLKDYLASAVDLVKKAAWSFPAFKQRTDGSQAQMDALLDKGLTDEETDALLEFAFERYYRTSGLFGTPDRCQDTLDSLRAIGVDEVACLIDFGIPRQLVLDGLPHLLEVKRLSDAKTSTTTATPATDATQMPATVAQQVLEHGVTHFQCTPSMAAMLLVDPQTETAFGRLKHMLVGGEALPDALNKQLSGIVGSLHNMYGPTETTVWSTTWELHGESPVPIGRPLRNQQVYLLDDNRQLVPEGEVGELWIGGAGVTAGYHQRPELNEERFVADHFATGSGARMYRTGDLARWREDGVLEFLGRVDHQVKIRGYRIELGEIETVLGEDPGVREVVVIAREDDGSPRLCAYLVPESGPLDIEALRKRARATLPEFMVPSHFVVMADLPRTPNQKVDRKALVAPQAASAATTVERTAAADDTEAQILAVWKEALGTEDIGVEDNFFDSGGHSILAVQVHHLIQDRLQTKLQMTDLFRFPTVRTLSKHIQASRAGTTEKSAAQLASERAAARRQGLRRR